MLLLMRHAKAGPTAQGGDDRGRRLTADGLVAATAMGRFLDACGYLPDLALVSDARRTRDTLDGIGPAMRVQPQVEYDVALYGADADQLLEHARTHGGEAHSVIIIGHNPAIADLALDLARKGDPAYRAALSHGFPPGAVAVFKVDCASWAALSPECVALERFATPAMVAAEDR